MTSARSAAATTALRARLGVATAAFRETLANPDLRRAQLAYGAVLAGEWAFTVALAVVAFRHGGARAVGLTTVALSVPAAVLVPFGAALSDRLRRERVLIGAGLGCALAIGCAAAGVASGAPLTWIVALASAANVALFAIRPVHSALLPALCRTPRQLTSATVVRGMMDSLGALVGPAAAAVGLAVAGPQAVLVAVSAAFVWSAVLIARVRYEAPPRVEVARRRLGREALEGIAALARHRDAAVVIGMAVAQTFTRGCLSVLVVVLSIDLLRSGEAGVGVLTAAIGAGAVAGSLGALMLAETRALARLEGVGVALWGLPLLACAVLPQQPAVIAFLAAVGVGNALVDVGLFSLPTRLVPEELVGRVFGIFESLVALSVGLGSLTASVLVEAVGIRGALLAIGPLCPLCVLVLWPRLCGIDREIARRDDEIGLLQRVPMLHELGLPAIERIATRLEPCVVASGAQVFEQSEPGDRFYVIASGTAEVRRDGVAVCALGPGDSFGEIALICDRPRTAGVRALGELHLRAVRGDDLLLAINGYDAATAAAQETVRRLLQGDALRLDPPARSPAPLGALPAVG
ncbi:MAG: hypothetical protein QOJ35_3816 [Solirubrobacteraceae bacterium]|nr:hypothetical protein [Solirubrobacteraceae bacterium]